MNLINNIKKRGLKDIFSFRVFAYIESILQKLFGIRTKQEDQVAFAEQIIFRSVMCKPCQENKSCLHCGCDWNDLVTSKTATCSEGRWGKIYNKKDWENYKSKYLHNIDFGFVTKKKNETDNNN